MTAVAFSYYTTQEAQALFNQGNEAYYRENYASAKESYSKLLEHGFDGADVLYNLGTACLAQGDLGGAVLYFERALRVSSQRGDIEANLAVARSRQLDQVVGAQLDEGFVPRLAASTSAEVVGLGFGVLWTVGFGLLLLKRLMSPRKKAWIKLGAAVSLIGAFALALVLSTHVYVRETAPEAVVISSTLSAREFPQETAKASFEVHAGLKVRLIEDSGKFTKIRLPNGLEGWAEKDGVARI